LKKIGIGQTSYYHIISYVFTDITGRSFLLVYCLLFDKMMIFFRINFKIVLLN